MRKFHFPNSITWYSEVYNWTYKPAQDFERSFLKTVETGAGLFFIFMDADAFDLQDSRYTGYFSSDFNIWSERAEELYKTMEEDFGNLYDQYIVDHQKLAKGSI